MIKYFVIRNFRGTCSSIKVVKWYMVRERLRTPALGQSAGELGWCREMQEKWLTCDVYHISILYTVYSITQL